jgi:radical SAM protein with 4Fe4S-binding SPASM domain
LTERCNNNCIHCYINRPAGDYPARERELSTSVVKSILTEAAALGALSIRLTGGEPLLREDFQEIYLHARQLGLAVLIFTNACLITPELADLFARVPPLRKIQVSVYGIKRESYEAVSRAPGSYKAFRRGIELLLQRRIPFLVKGALLPPNIAEIKEMDAWAQSLPWAEGQPGYSMFFDLRSRRESETRNREILNLRHAPEIGLAVLRRKEDLYLDDMRQFCGKFMGPPGDKLFACGAGATPCVDAYGNLQACMLLRHPDTVYELTNGSIKDALVDYIPKVCAKRATNSDYLSRCARCFLKGLCEQCPAKSWTEHGTLDTPVEYLCRIAHTQAKELGLLGEGERSWEVIDWKDRVLSFTNGTE